MEVEEDNDPISRDLDVALENISKNYDMFRGIVAQLGEALRSCETERDRAEEQAGRLEQALNEVTAELRKVETRGSGHSQAADALRMELSNLQRIKDSQDELIAALEKQKADLLAHISTWESKAERVRKRTNEETFNTEIMPMLDKYPRHEKASGAFSPDNHRAGRAAFMEPGTWVSEDTFTKFRRQAARQWPDSKRRALKGKLKGFVAARFVPGKSALVPGGWKSHPKSAGPKRHEAMQVLHEMRQLPAGFEKVYF
jgi:chaperonin cofactor prefoldin